MNNNLFTDTNININDSDTPHIAIGEPFDPTAFGLKNRFAKRSKHPGSTNGRSVCRVSHSQNKNDKNGRKMYIALPNEVAERIISTFGKRISIDFFEDGAWYIWEGGQRAISAPKSGNSHTISVDLCADEYHRYMGEFNNLYLTPVFRSNHIKLTPTGERD